MNFRRRIIIFFLLGVFLSTNRIHKVTGESMGGMSGLNEGWAIAAFMTSGIEGDCFVIHIPDPSGDRGWIADDMTKEDSIVCKASSELKGGEYVVRFRPVRDGKTTVRVRHYSGIACDQMHIWDLTSMNGKITEFTDGYWKEASNDEAFDSYLLGVWLGQDSDASQMVIEKNQERGWDIKIAMTVKRCAHIFTATIYYDCDLNSFVYDRLRFMDLGKEENSRRDEISFADRRGLFTLNGNSDVPQLVWHRGQNQEEPLIFDRL